MSIKKEIWNILKWHLDTFHTNCMEVKVMVKVLDFEVPPYDIDILIQTNRNIVYKIKK